MGQAWVLNPPPPLSGINKHLPWFLIRAGQGWKDSLPRRAFNQKPLNPALTRAAGRLCEAPDSPSPYFQVFIFLRLLLFEKFIIIAFLMFTHWASLTFSSRGGTESALWSPGHPGLGSQDTAPVSGLLASDHLLPARAAPRNRSDFLDPLSSPN